jgi:hypothetical protein
MLPEEFEIKLLSNRVNVKICSPDSWAVDGMGRCDIRKLQILVSNDMPKDIVDTVFIHELVHMISDLNGIEFPEHCTDALALGFVSFLKNNPQIVANIIAET